MRRRSFQLALLLGASFLVLSGDPVRGYIPIRWGAAGVRLLYSVNRFPLQFQVNDKTARGTGNVESGSDVVGALRGAVSAWQDIPTASIRFADLRQTSVESTNLSDGVNLITMVDTAANNQLVGSNTLAVTNIAFSPATGEIRETDIVFNSRIKFSTNLAAGSYDLQAVATHELGHVLGCDHAAAQNDTMFFLVGAEEFFQRFLSVDSVSFASFTYPHASRAGSVGSIAGRVSLNAGGIFGASVTAVELDRNLIYTTMTEPDGSYTLTGPIPGKYVMYAEPLDGPAPADALLVSGGDAFYKTINASFRTVVREEFDYSSPDNPGLVLRKTGIDFPVPSGAVTLNINRMGRNNPRTGSIYLARGPAAVFPGEDLTLTIGGPDTWKVTSIDDIRFLGSGITVDRARGVRVVKDMSGAEVGISAGIRVSPDALPGPRTLLVRVDDQQVASTGGIVVAMRSIPTRYLYMPYLQTSPEQYTGIALANPSGTPAVVRIKGRDPQGNLLYDLNAIVPADLSIPAGAQIARLERQVFNLPPSARQTGSLSIESDSAALQGFFLTGGVQGSFLDGAEASTRAFKELHFVDVLQNSATATEIHLQNVRDIPVSVRMSLLGAAGTPLRATVTRTVPAWGKIGDTVSNLFGIGDTVSSAHVKVETDEDSLVGFGFIRQAETVFGINALPPEKASSTLYAPQLAVGNLGLNFSTRLNIVNVGDSPASVTLKVLGDDGREIPLPNTHPPAVILAGGHLTLDALTYFGFTGPTQGAIQITAASGGAKLLGNILFGDGDPSRSRLSFGAALPLSAEGSKAFLFSQVAQGAGFYTGVAFFAPDGADLTMDVFRENGVLSGTRSLSLRSGTRVVALLQDLVPATRDQMRGYIRVNCDKKVIAFALFGATDGRFLSAVPPQLFDSN